MSKQEIIWREILFQTLEKDIHSFTQKELAAHFFISLSTVFNSLRGLRQINAIKVTGRNFEITQPEKILYFWATKRNLNQEIIYKTHFDGGPFEIEGMMPAGIIFTAYSAFRKKFNEAPADYDKVYVYADNLDEIKKRFPPKNGYENLIVLKADKFLENYGLIAPLSQIFVDLWNLPEWYAKDFLEILRCKLIK